VTDAQDMGDAPDPLAQDVDPYSIEAHTRNLYGRYREAFSTYGATAAGVGWSNEKEQGDRLDVLSDPILQTTYLYGGTGTPVTVLDVGCGYGLFYQELDFNWPEYCQLNYTGIDTTAEAIEWAEEKYKRLIVPGSDDKSTAKWIKGDFLSTPALPYSYDWVVASGTLNYHHPAVQMEMLKRMWLLCKKGIVFNMLDATPYFLGAIFNMFQASEWEWRGGYVKRNEITATFWKDFER
jgi:SAM-dependent methyltransferase